MEIFGMRYRNVDHAFDFIERIEGVLLCPPLPGVLAFFVNTERNASTHMLLLLYRLSKSSVSI